MNLEVVKAARHNPLALGAVCEDITMELSPGGVRFQHDERTYWLIRYQTKIPTLKVGDEFYADWVGCKYKFRVIG